MSLSGTEATVFSVSRNSETKLVIIVTITSVSKDKEGYDLEVYDLQWDKAGAASGDLVPTRKSMK